MKYCTSCGKEIKEEAKFCPKCGFSFEKGKVKRSEDRKKSQKVLVILAIVFGVMFLVGAFMVFLGSLIPIKTTTTGKKTPINIFNKDNVKIKKSETSTITYHLKYQRGGK